MAGEELDQKITLARPEAGQTQQVAMQPGRTYVVDFDQETATFDRRDADVYVCFDDGAVLSLNGFLNALGQGDFYLELSDGTLLSAKDVFEVLTMDLTEFHTDGAVVAEADDSAANAGQKPEAHAAPAGEPIAEGLGSLLEPGEETDHVCDGRSVCSLFDEALEPHLYRDPRFDLPEASEPHSLTPHMPHNGLPLVNILEPAAPPPLFHATQAGETLLWEDLLDTSAALPLGGDGGLPLFERLFISCRGEDPTQMNTDALSPVSLGDSGTDDADQWLLAFLHMSSC